MKALLSFLLVLSSAAQAVVLTVSDSTHHLGLRGRPEWAHFEGKEPEGESLVINFEGRRNAREHTLFIRQDDVKQAWTVTLNGNKVGQLFLMEADVVHTIPLPPGVLLDGSNRLEIAARTPEDILIHRIWIGDESKENLLNGGPVTFHINDGQEGSPIPARITIVDANGSFTPIFDFGGPNLASRPGVVYTGDGKAKVKLLPGKYTAYATRGPEYSPASHQFELTGAQSVTLTIRREADTAGWVSSDTHIHTLSLSKHGDATLRERIITIAGEGIELPISTEHNLHADYGPTSRELGLDKYFTGVPGNEVTTKKGHFNIFPVEPGGTPPNASSERWTELFQGIKETSRVKVITLNHPLDSHSGFVPFASTNLQVLTGRYARDGFPFEFTAMELVNSGAMRSSWTEPFRAWFALLNRGHRIVGVGSSDSHDVSRFIVGQGRTYVQVDDSNVGQINVAQACENLNQGRALVSLGMIARMTLAEPGTRQVAGPGDLLKARDAELIADIRIDSPLAPDKASYLCIWANGVAQAFEAWGAPKTNRVTLKNPAHDTYYVLIAEIEANPEPHWGLARPYQPTSKKFRPALIGATNPIWVDADGDGKFTPPREYAQMLLAKHRESPRRLLGALAKYDNAVIWQCADQLQLTRESEYFAASNGLMRKRFEEYLEAQQILTIPSAPSP